MAVSSPHAAIQLSLDIAVPAKKGGAEFPTPLGSETEIRPVVLDPMFAPRTQTRVPVTTSGHGVPRHRRFLNALALLLRRESAEEPRSRGLDHFYLRI